MGKRDLFSLRVNIDFKFAKLIQKLLHTDADTNYAARYSSKNYVHDALTGTDFEQVLSDPLLDTEGGASLFKSTTDALNESTVKVSESCYEKLRDRIEPLLSVNVRLRNDNQEPEKFLAFVAPHVVDMDGSDAVVGMIRDDDQPLKTTLVVFHPKVQSFGLIDAKL